MSDVEAWKGKIVPLHFDNDTDRDQWIMDKIGRTELPSYADNWIEQLMDDCYDNYHYDDKTNILYEIEKEELDTQFFMNIEKNDDGSYNFSTSFYNGGTFLNEMLQNGIDSIS